ncbi:hypothetical protein EYY20_21080 [Escherichia coli]|uniref:hypothetical protein n=1 Tax=Escherichia coli TaxID=562 RepID=UPI0010AA35F6|nr:hypothetical protein [Escherichia coli]MBM1177271.1 hypothetical protein [Escherichia coli]TIJ01492.1 hypothetical protein EYY20_21080 [Escherichia coli]WGB67798.1 hypothetical protein NFL45_10355 [Escherichia coli]WPA75742.1 hypothetical protein SA976_10830 [Escherichia coli]HAW6879917.1 hypothetical protein [Escherichia coli]
MITITKERLLTIKQWRETYGPGSNVVLPAEEAEELARIALASLEAEPVAWTDEEELRDVRKYGFGEIFQCPPDKYADPRRVISLYRELPAPVVPDDWQLVPKKITLEMECALSKADSYEIGWLWALAAAPKYEVQNAKRVQNALNACRAAMPQAGNFRENKNSSTSSPATPDDWISCSERTSGKQVIELTMLVKQLVSQLKKAKPDCKLPDRAMDYLLRNGLISVEGVLR